MKGILNNVNISTITVTYDNDLNFLKYNLKSFDKFCKGYDRNVVVLDDIGSKKTEDYLNSINQEFFINHEAKKIHRGYIRQQYIKLFSEQYFPKNTDYICHVDSDNIFTDHHDPSIYFKNNKPILGITKWKDMQVTAWREHTDRAVGFKTSHEYMRRMPLIYPTWLFPDFRDYLNSLHTEGIINFLNSTKTFSEYNALGAYAYKYHKDEFYWIDTHSQKEEWHKIYHGTPCKQYSNRKEAQPHRYVDLSQPDNVISNLFK